MTKRIAIQLFGHLRTFEKTYESFLKNIVEANKKSGYEIDIFIHTWDELEPRASTWHNHNISLKNIKISPEMEEKVMSVYKPKKIIIDESIIEHGSAISIAKVTQLREEYEKENNIKYDWVIETRPDVIFFKPFIIYSYIKTFNMYYCQNTDPKECIYLGNNLFGRMNIAHPDIVAESDILYFYNPYVDKTKITRVPVKYLLYKDFSIMREFGALEKGKAKGLKTRFKLFVYGICPYNLVWEKINRLRDGFI